ncbi:MAG: hypothetical protein GC165_16500 [Armatimonadetes bacterium]|nr:hypothetical protein [Armatimonadota bacterium]MBS1725269.1 hypothetical protein [Armatimonadota bacterium]
MKYFKQILLFGLLATILSCGGSGVSVFTSANLRYAAPSLIQNDDGNSPIVICSVAHDGKMIGNTSSSLYYWTGPLAPPTNTGLVNYKYSQVNSNGSMISSAGFYNSVVANPFHLTTDPTGLWTPYGINDLGEGIAQVEINEGMIGGFWDVDHTFHQLPIADASQSYGVFNLTNSKRFFGAELDYISFDKPVVLKDTLVWNSPTSLPFKPTYPSDPGSGYWWPMKVNTQTGVAVFAAIDSSFSVEAAGVLPANETEVFALQGSGIMPLGISDNGIIIGGMKDAGSSTLVSTTYSPYVWPNKDEAAVPLNSVVTDTSGWELGTPIAILGNGDIIGAGKYTVGGVTKDAYYYLKRL